MGTLKKLGVAVFVLASSNLFAQQITGSIRGTVTDPSNAVVDAATVTAKQTETGLTRSTTTDQSGTYLLLELPVGHYQLQVEGKGFHKYIQQGITLNVNETATVPVHLTVGAEDQVVQVESDARDHSADRHHARKSGYGARDSGSSAERPQFHPAGHYCSRVSCH